MLHTTSHLVVLLVALAFALTARFALAAITTSGAGAIGQGSYIPPACSNSLDFTQSCNSQYIGAIL